RKRSADLLAVASRYGSFPMILETYRECLRDVFDLPGLLDILRRIASRRIRVVAAESRVASPFAASILFSYVANFVYDGDAPLAERRAQALSVDQAQLKELLGQAELRDLLDPDAIEELGRSLQRLDGTRAARHADGLHDLLLGLGDLTADEVRLRSQPPEAAGEWLESLRRDRRIVEVGIAGERRWVAAEDAGRLRDALGIVIPPGLPDAFLESPRDPLGDLISRYARTHPPFLAEAAAARFDLPIASVRMALERLAAAGRVVEGEFLPSGRTREWCDAEVLRSLKRRSLARLRREVEPVLPAALGRFLADWQGVRTPRKGLDALLSAIEQLQGCPLPASVLESEILAARVSGYKPADLDLLCAAGEVLWRGIESVGPSDGRIALHLPDRYALLARPGDRADGELAGRLREILSARGALFFSDLARETGAFAGDLVRSLWDLVWAGEVTNDTLAPLRSFLKGAASEERRSPRNRSFRSRRSGPPGSEGRWSLLPGVGSAAASETERRTALAASLLERYGVVTREAVHAEGIAGGFSAVYPIFQAMEQAGRIRRGYFVAGLGATQFALPGADDRLRFSREPAPEGEGRTWILAAADPANPYGAAVPWPDTSEAAPRPSRAAGARVLIREGELLAASGRGERSLVTFLPPEEPERTEAARAIASTLAGLVEEGRRRAVLIGRIDGGDPGVSPLSPFLAAAGFTLGSRGYLKRAAALRSPGPADNPRSSASNA
ncbi:MAG: DEAD/DEAH box helicase, partial [Acidobacteriota bacterium]